MGPEVLKTKVITLTPENQEVLAFVQASIASIPEGIAPELREQEEAEIIDFVREFEGREEIMAAWVQDIGTQKERGGWIDRVLEASGIAVKEVTSVNPETESLTSDEVVRRFEQTGYVTRPPRFEELIKDESRTKLFQYDQQPPGDSVDRRGNNTQAMTEIDGLKDLWNFLGNYLKKASQPHRLRTNGRFGAEAKQAKSIRENLTFIGEREFQEATAGLATIWKAYLDEDPKRQLCIITGASKLPQYRLVEKSDSFVKKAVLANFKEDEDEKYLDRMVDSPDDLTAQPVDARVVILDDWSVSGRQMFSVLNDLFKNKSALKYASSMEINLLAAPKGRIDKGLQFGLKTTLIKVRAYYEAYEARETGDKDVECHITGAHSTVNFGFGVTIEELVKTLNRQTKAIGQKSYKIPAIASIYRDYWRTSYPDSSQNSARKTP